VTTWVPRSEWGARPARPGIPALNPADTYGVVLHHNGPAMGIVDHSQCWVKVLNIQSYHMNTKGWLDIAYTALFCDHGYVFEGRGWHKRQGANGDDDVGPDDGPDSRWLTFMWLGGIGEVPSAEAMEAARWCVAEARARGAGWAVKPHSDFKNKPCPGDELRAFARQFDGINLGDEMSALAESQVNDLWNLFVRGLSDEEKATFNRGGYAVLATNHQVLNVLPAQVAAAAAAARDAVLQALAGIDVDLDAADIQAIVSAVAESVGTTLSDAVANELSERLSG
jgi:hypothetical protein